MTTTTTTLPGFEPGSLIHAGARSRILRARRQHDGAAVVLKTLASTRPSSQAVARLRREWEIGQSFNHPNVVRYLGLEIAEHAAAIVMEDSQGVSLAERIPARGFSIERFLDLAIQLTRGLAAIHAQRVIHKDIKPRNILIDASGQHLQFIDFGVSARLDDDEHLTVAPNRLEGTLAYISPEQTGRMNRALDHRADLYSLGATFYELLCGRVPFTATEALELVHCHLAKLPEAPQTLRPEIPEPLSRMVMKLLAKAPEDRYQGARGLLHDLRRCREALLRSRGTLHGAPALAAFELGAHDRGPELRVPDRLFGREPDLGVLERAWDRAQRGQPAVVLVSGCSGVGKSALVAELESRLRDRSGAFISGKFSQLGSRAAYEGFSEAFQSLAGRILGAGMDEFRGWGQRLSSALAINGRLVLDVVPEMEPIVGPLPPVAALGPEESQHRFNHVFRRFVRACARDGQPLTLFLDDLQWADPGSLALLELLAHDQEQSHLLLIAAIRDDEIDAAHPTRHTLEQIRESRTPLVELPLRALAVAEVEALIAEALSRMPPRSRELAELVVERTGGNPLFVRTFLQMAWEEKLLTAEEPRGEGLGDELGEGESPAVSWSWDEAGLRQMQASESIGELLARRIQQLPASTREVLRTAACFGASFTHETVAAINDTSPAATLADLHAAARSGMILLRTDERWEFVHDRVREASHALLPADERAAAHLRIGRMLLDNTPADRLSERIFSIVDHLDTGRSLIRTTDELAGLARLAEIAGTRAQMGTAYATAVRYLRTGVECLALLDTVEPPAAPDRAWREHYDLALGLHRNLAIAEYLSDDVEASLGHIATALTFARDAVDRVELLDLLVFHHTMATRYDQAVATGRQALALVDIHLPDDSTAIDQALSAALAEYRERLGDRPVASLIDLPEMRRRDTRAAARLLATLMSAAYSADHRLFPLVTLKLVNLSLACGSLPESSYGYAHHGTFVGAVLGDYASAHELGKLALALACKRGDLAQEARACTIVAGFVLPWRAHVRECDVLNDRGQQAALESGQLQFAGYIQYHRQLLHMFAGIPLDRLEVELAQALPQLRGINHAYAANVVRGVQLIVAGLLGERPAGEARELDTLAREFAASCRASHSHIAICVYQIYRAQLLYLHGEFEAAVASLSASKEFLPYAIGHIAIADRNFYHSLALAALLREQPAGTDDDRRQVALATIEHNQAQMARWARSCPANFDHKHLLVAAELARYDGDTLGALDLYDRAIASAGEHGFIHIQALACEGAARMWLQRGNDRLALPYLGAAISGYRSWGARHKLALLEAELPELCGELALSASRPRFTHTSEPWAGVGSSQALDLATVTRASQAISSEIDLDRLLARMMRIILLNAGANRGFLILEAEDDFRIEAAASSEVDEVELHRKLPLGDGELAVNIIRHVLRSGENVVLEDAHRRGPFTDDPHVVRRRLKSVLCTPIRHKDELVGVLYLENEHAAAAFTEARTEVLQILLSQAAISLENARYYNELKTLNTELRSRADELSESKTQLEAEISERERGQVERLQLEAQLRQSQKMEAIGQLAGGVAHDFNNLLTSIIGSTDVLGARMRLHDQPSPEARRRSGADEVRVIREAAERGASLTRQLLAFSRRQVLQPEIVDLNSLVERSGTILERLLGAGCVLRLGLGDQLGRVRVDPGQLEQVILNLVINARDAMRPGGRVDVRTRIELLGEQRPAQPQAIEPGEWVVLSVSDTGSGMERRTIAHIFEPFFTTKGVGEGTGLGLSTVLGIVQQSEGYVTVDSTVGVGTTFEVWLPRMTERASESAPQPELDDPDPTVNDGGETVLVVEDEAPVRRTVEQILLLHGYTVLTAEDGEACVQLCAGHAGIIDLVLTDFVMPRLGGLDLAAKLRVLRPHTKVLFMSGFTDGQLDQAKVDALGGIELIEKPFRAAALLERIRELLDRRP